MVNLKEIMQMSIPERILLVETIWDSIEADTLAGGIPFTEAQLRETTRRLEMYESGKSKTYTWEEVLSYVREK
jgi:putative addiction module component (TIGR02574 family)